MITKNIGMLLLAIYLILVGIIVHIPAIAGPPESSWVHPGPRRRHHDSYREVAGGLELGFRQIAIAVAVMVTTGASWLLKIIRFDQRGAGPAIHSAHHPGVVPGVKVRENR